MKLVDRIVEQENRQRALLSRLRQTQEPVLIYGAGVYACVLKRFLVANGVTVSALMVDPAYRCDDFLFGVEVVTPDEVALQLRDCHVVIGMVNYPAAIEKAAKLGAREIHVIDIPDYLNMPDAFMDIEFLRAHSDQFEQAARLFADDLSRETYVAAINTKINEDLTYIKPYVRLDNLYFPAAKIPLRNDEILLDVGGFTGDTVREFHQLSNGQYARIISLEPGAENFVKLQSTIDALQLSRVIPLKIGAWDEKTSLQFATNEMHIDNQIAGDGATQINVDTIDSILGSLGSDVSLIKLDINGAECRAISGAAEAIRRCQPRIVVRLHTKEAFFILPILLSELAPGIKLHLRQRNYMSMMLVLYGTFHSI